MTQAHAFISYVRENRDIVDRLAKDCREAGVNVWLDRDDIMPGQRWKSAIRKAIQEGAFFIACYSKELNERPETYMNGELRLAIDRLRTMPNNRVWFIPIFLNETFIPEHDISDHETLADINAIALYEDWDAGLQKIFRAMNLDNPDHRRALHLIDLIKYHPSERLHAINELARVVAPSRGFRVTPSGGFEALSIPRAALAEAIPALVGVLGVAEREIRQLAAEKLAKIGIAAIPALTEVLRTGRTEARIWAARALWEMGSLSFSWAVAEATVPALILALHDSEQDVRDIATVALGKIGPRAVPALAVELCDTNKKIRSETRMALSMMRHFWRKRSDRTRIREALSAENRGRKLISK
jgi:hypothetical protein